MPLKKRVFEILEGTAPNDQVSKVFSFFMMILIALNILALVVETMDPIYEAVPALFHWVEVISITISSAEYVLRLWSCTAMPIYRQPILGRIRYALKPLLMIDLLAILPCFMPFLGLDLRFLRAFRLVRFFRVAKLGRYSSALQTMRRVLL